MKRKAVDDGIDIGNDNPNGNADSHINPAKKRLVTDPDPTSRFRRDLFDERTLERCAQLYASAHPYKHGVLSDLIDPDLLRAVRREIQTSLHFTPKETDIYRIHQSGDLANLDGLDDASVARLPSLRTLRDALYSSAFRAFLATVTGAGPLSGRKTDMAINVYTPGCHLLCHDDVIGSRRVSYILYLTDPDRPWQREWGGALRLYPTNTTGVGVHGPLATKIASPQHEVAIPPAWNQLSFFAVQPGESFHDVEEVYAGEGEGEGEGADTDTARVRTAISGWYHLPQPGEEGYIAGLEEQLAEKSSLAQLQSHADPYDLPQPQVRAYDDDGPRNPGAEDEDDDDSLSEADLDFLLRYLAPNYLTPDTVDGMCDRFAGESTLRLDAVLNASFAARLHRYITAHDGCTPTLDPSDASIEPDAWSTARPPYKHRFLYQQRGSGSRRNAPTDDAHPSPIRQLLDDLLPSSSFRKWLALVTGLALENSNVVARRFRRGMDYTLATGYEKAQPRLELTLCVTPSTGWDDDDEDDEDDKHVDKHDPADDDDKHQKAPRKAANGEKRHAAVGGYEMYMVTDDAHPSADPAVYSSTTSNPAAGDDPANDNGVLFTSPPAWNQMCIVLRDCGVLRFVKYVSRAAPGDRWDVAGEYGVRDEDEDDEEKLEEEEEEHRMLLRREVGGRRRPGRQGWDGFGDEDWEREIQEELDEQMGLDEEDEDEDEEDEEDDEDGEEDGADGEDEGEGKKEEDG
ncbi:MAG: hypothetical protein M1826_005331 [Phylliscum demangeonii]|nr:MAG: hypothetical protein M1826_005331 [Phylliscum demangeonii]